MQIECYLERKYQEILLLNEHLRTPRRLSRPKSVAAAIELKFRLAAAIKAEHALQRWAMTETSWSEAERFRSGPFRFAFGYQRADLEIAGPAIYKALCQPARETLQQTLYTCSGMAAISAVIMALRKISPGAVIAASKGCYSETAELIENFGAPVRTTTSDVMRRADAFPKILLVDSSASTVDRIDPTGFDLILFDTTCYLPGSHHVGRVLDAAFQRGLPAVLVRSHAKLDTLGVEYGRLGSLVCAASLDRTPEKRLRWLSQLLAAIAEAVRLSGGAAIPAHFPPFAGSKIYEELSGARVAAIQANHRYLMGRLRAVLPRFWRVLPFQHGLYAAFAPREYRSRDIAKAAAADLCREYRSVGLPVRHAGSFGFDFVAVDWFGEAAKETALVRMSMPDLPPAMIEKAIPGLCRWWIRQIAGEEGSFNPPRDTELGQSNFA